MGLLSQRVDSCGILDLKLEIERISKNISLSDTGSGLIVKIVEFKTGKSDTSIVLSQTAIFNQSQLYFLDTGLIVGFFEHSKRTILILNENKNSFCENELKELFFLPTPELESKWYSKLFPIGKGWNRPQVFKISFLVNGKGWQRIKVIGSDNVEEKYSVLTKRSWKESDNFK